MTVRKPSWALTYNGKDISRDLAGRFVSVSFTDHLSGASDDMALELDDRDGDWAASPPIKGDTVSLKIGYEGEQIPAGEFRIDEIELKADRATGARLIIKALAAAVTTALRTVRSQAFEDMTFGDIADKIAADNSLARIGDVPATKFARVSQAEETDAAFLTRLADQAGLAFTVRGQALVFYQKTELEAAPTVATLQRADLIRYSLKDRVRETYKAAEVTYLDPTTGQTFTHVEQAAGVASGDTLKVEGRPESQAQAIILARDALAQANRLLTTGNLTVSGNTACLAGNAIQLEGVGRMSGKYLVQQSVHKIDRHGGYTTDLEVRLVL